jgi:UDP-glucuronate decarboxylase
MNTDNANTVLVTGAAGFIGSHLCEALLARGHRVMALDNLSTGDIAHLDRLLGHKGFTFQKRDVGLEPTPEMAQAGRVFNLACPASPAHYQQAPVDTVLSSVLGAWRLLELAQRSGARLLHTSTSEVYGDPEQHPQREDYWGHVNPNGARSCYDEGKRCAEAMLMAYRQQRGVDVCMARIFNTYGPRLSPGDGRVVSNFIVQALQGDDLTIYGDGQQTRSFCYVDDTLRGLLRQHRQPRRAHDAGTGRDGAQADGQPLTAGLHAAAAGRPAAALPGHLTGQVHAGLAAGGGTGGRPAADHPPFPRVARGAERDGRLIVSVDGWRWRQPRKR